MGKSRSEQTMNWKERRNRQIKNKMWTTNRTTEKMRFETVENRDDNKIKEL